jgi:hypothetical protein
MERALKDLERAARESRTELGSVGASHRKLGKDTDSNTLRMGRLTNAMANFNIQARFMERAIGLLKFPAMISAVGLATQAISALTAGVVALSGALAPAAGLIAAYPALLGALAQGAIVGKVAFGELKEAIGGNEDALKRLTPEARKFANAFKNEVRPALKSVQRDIQTALLPGLSQAMDTLTQPRVLNVFRRAGTRTAGVLGDAAAGFARSMAQPRQLGQLDQFLSGNTKMLRSLTTALLPATRGLLELMNAAQPLTQWLGRLAVQGARWFEATVRANKASGDLTKFFGQTRQVVTVLGHLLRDFGGALRNIMQIGAPLGRTILKDLAGAAKSFRDWTESAGGRNAIVEWFKQAKGPLYEMGRLLRDLTGIFFRLGSGNQLTPLLRQIRIELLPVLEQMVATTTAAFGPALVDLLVQVGRAFGSIAGASGPLVVFVDALTMIVDLFADLITSSPQVQQLFVTLAGAFAVMKAVNFFAAITGLRTMLGLTTQLVAQTRAAATAQAGMAASGALAGAGGAAGAARTAQMSSATAAAAGGLGALGGAAGGAAGNATKLVGVLGRVAGFAGPFGIIAGIVASLGLSFILTGRRADKAADQVSDLRRELQELKTAQDELKGAQHDEEEAESRLEHARINAIRSRQTVNQIMRQGIATARDQAEAEGKAWTPEMEARARRAVRRTLAWRDAHVQLTDAMRERADAAEEVDKAGAKTITAHGKIGRAEQELRQEALRTNQEFRDKRVKAMNDAERASARLGTVEERHRAIQEAGAKVVRDYNADMDKLAADARRDHIPRMERYAEAAKIVARRINDIPSDKQINVQMEVSATLKGVTMGVRRAETSSGVNPASGDVRAAGRMIDGTLRAGVGNATDAFFEHRRGDIESALTRMFPVQPNASVTPGLWDELAMGTTYGLSLTSSYRPMATVHGSGRRSLHSFNPSRAIDMAGSTSSMRAYAQAVHGRSGLTEVIYSGYGPTTSSDPITRADHFDHVHVGAGMGDVGGRRPRTGQPENAPTTRDERLERSIERLREALEKVRERLGTALDKMTDRALRVFDALTERQAERTPAAQALKALDEAAKAKRLADIQRRMQSGFGATRREAEQEMREFLEEQAREQLEQQAEEEKRQLEVRREEQRIRLEGRITRLRGRINRGQLRGPAARRQMRNLLASYGITAEVGGDVVGEAFQAPFAASMAAIGPIATQLWKAARELKEAIRASHGHQAGGMIGGTDRGFDSQLIMARPGELILNAAQQGNVARQLSGPGVVVVLNNPTFLTGDRAAAQQLARLVAPEIERQVVLRT